MGDESHELECTQTQTQNSQVEWSQRNTPSFIPNIWGRLYSTKVSLSGSYCWKDDADKQNPEYYDLIQPEFSLGRALSCTIAIRKDIIKENIIKNVSKQHFVIKRDMSETLSPAIITDLSYNGTFVNGIKIGKGNSRVLDDNDEISVTNAIVKIFLFKDLLKNEQYKVPKGISDKYYIARVLGQGACGIVKLVYDKTKCTKHAMKIIKKSRFTNGQINHLNDPAKILNEVKIMKALRHPFIISTEEVFECCDAVYIVLELMQGGELFDRISKHERLTERLTRFLFRQMVLAVKYLHSQGITHRDLKPENVLLKCKEEETLLKITDFGLSKFVGEDSFMKTMCGTPLYLAPEVLKANGYNSYGPEVDVWSLGVIFFVCLVGYLPFSSDYTEISLRDQILSGKYRFSHTHWRGVSLQGKLLMKRMLTVNVERRITLEQILKHSWMQISVSSKPTAGFVEASKLEYYRYSMGAMVTQKRVLNMCEQLLTAVASTAGLESIFSSFGLVQSKLRNRLGIDKANKLVYMLKRLNNSSAKKRNLGWISDPTQDDDFSQFADVVDEMIQNVIDIVSRPDSESEDDLPTLFFPAVKPSNLPPSNPRNLQYTISQSLVRVPESTGGY